MYIGVGTNFLKLEDCHIYTGRDGKRSALIAASSMQYILGDSLLNRWQLCLNETCDDGIKEYIYMGIYPSITS